MDSDGAPKENTTHRLCPCGPERNTTHRLCSCGAVLRPTTMICPACQNTGRSNGLWLVGRTVKEHIAGSSLTSKGGLDDEVTQ